MRPGIVILVADEHDLLRRSLAALKDLGHPAEHILVVCDRDPDTAEAVCAPFGVRCLFRAFDGVVGQRRYAAENLDTDTVWFLDADEIVTKELYDEIAGADARYPCPVAIRRMNIVFGRPLMHGGWFPDLQTRIFDRQQYQSDPGQKAQSVCAEGHLLHYSHETAGEWASKGIRSAKVAARRGRLPLLPAVKDCFRRLTAQQGYRDGWQGWVTILYLFVFACAVNLYAATGKTRDAAV